MFFTIPVIIHIRKLRLFIRLAKGGNLNTSIDAKYLEAVEEFLAEKASLGVEDGTTWQKICAAFRQFLRNMGLNIAYSDNDIQQLFRQSLRAVQNKTGGSVGKFGSIGSVRYMAEPFTEQQKRDLLQQARNSGLKNIDVIEKMLYGGTITINGNTVNFDGKNSHALKLHLNALGFKPQRGPVTLEEIQKYLPEVLKQKPIHSKKKIKKNRSKTDLKYETVINGVRYRLVTKYNGLFENFYSNKKGVGDVNSQKAGSASIQRNNILSQNPEKSSENSEKMRFSIAPVWTGSAADYDKPALHAVGTGEGQQVYGWGLYGSESREVAEWYAEKFFRIFQMYEFLINIFIKNLKNNLIYERYVLNYKY